MEKIAYPRFMIICDNFYKNPDKVLQAARKANYFEPEFFTGYRSDSVYHESGVKQKLERILGIKITRFDKDPAEENGVFYQGFSKGSRAEIPGVHSDEPYNDITALIYLSPGLPIDCGTSLWMHKSTGLINPPQPEDARRLGMSITALRAMLEKDSKTRSKWIEIDRAGNRFNRLVAYPSGVFHSATRHYGSTIKNGRLYQTFRIGVNWKSFRMSS